MWSYYGSKTNIVDAYPKPLHQKIKEPFAGTARYSLKYFDHDIELMDKYDVIVKIWKWLQLCSPNDILSLPRFKTGQNINHHIYDCEEQRFLVGFLVGFGFTEPRKTATPRLRNRPNAMEYTIRKIAGELYKIKHWKITLGSYEEMLNEPATWFIDPPYQFIDPPYQFIDPPYQFGGHAYKMSNKKIDFEHLGSWSSSRKGQIIVCENTRATWMDFKPLINQNVLSGKNSEAIWTNQKVSYMGKQLEII